MKPDWENKKQGIQLYLNDCLKVMPSVTSSKVDAVITDPPYGLDFRGNDWDSFIPKWIKAARKLSETVIFTTAPTTLWDYPRPDWVCCWYREASNSRSNLKGGFNHWSPIIVYGKPKFAVDCIKLHAISNSYPKGFLHPSPKPLALLDFLISNATKNNDRVFDPFMGSGTTGVSCVNLGRKFVGIEIDQSYFDLSVKRIEAAIKKKSMSVFG